MGVRDQEAVTVFIDDCMRPGKPQPVGGCNMTHYSKVVATDLLQRYRRAYGALPGEVPTNAQRPDEQTDDGS